MNTETTELLEIETKIANIDSELENLFPQREEILLKIDSLGSERHQLCKRQLEILRAQKARIMRG